MLGDPLFRYHAQAVQSSLSALKRKALPTVMTISVIALTLALPTLAWVFIDNVAQFAKHWQRNGQIFLYLDVGQSQGNQERLLERVRSVDGVGQATLKTPDDGLELLKQAGMQDIMQALPENPLPAVIEVIPAVNLNTSGKIEGLYLYLKTLPGIEEAKLDMQWVKRLYALLEFSKQLIYILVSLLAFAVVFIISNTLRVAIHNCREEIEVLKLIGATDAYITRPFLYTGIWYGLGAAAVAFLLVNGFIFILDAFLEKLASVYEITFLINLLTMRQASLLFLFAIALGWLASWVSVKRQLILIEPSN